MKSLALLIDFGSTYTKVAAVDLETAAMIDRSQAPSTVATDVREGLLQALIGLRDRRRLLIDRPANIECLADYTVLASSSAAGGLRMAVVGLVPGLTVEAANMAALGAGAKLVGSWSFKLDPIAAAEIEAQRPDMILLTGGTDGGDAITILHNARLLARSNLAVPVIVAGNQAAGGEVREILANNGKEARLAANVMPRAGELQVESAREEIRKLFMERITRAKGLEALSGVVPVIVPTPMAVLSGARLGAQGAGAASGWGDMVVVDVGGATTDVHSIGYGRPSGPSLVEQGLPEAFAKRTVEGDLGIRSNAGTLVDRVGRESFKAQFLAAFPHLEPAIVALATHIETLCRETAYLPAESWQSALDAQLARTAIDLAIERHAGRRERILTGQGEAWVYSGKDLSDTRVLIGTGGVFIHNPYARYILSGTAKERPGVEILRPKKPTVFIDRSYVLYAVGLLADHHADVALQVFNRNMRALEAAPITEAL